MSIEEQLRQSLLPVFGFDSIDQIPADAPLVTELGADSLDFIEIVYLIERDFGVVLKTAELVLTEMPGGEDDLFVEGRLTEEGAALLREHLPGSGGRFAPGLTKADLFQSITVRDLANIIQRRRAC